MKILRTITISTLGVVALWIAIGFITWLSLDSMEERGQAGDMFGLANSLFSALAFTAVIVSLIYQHHSLKLERDDFKLTLEETRRSAEAATEQARILSNQLKLELLKKEIDTTTFVIGQLSHAMTIPVSSSACGLYQSATVSALVGKNSLDEAAKVLEKKYAELDILIKTVKEQKDAQPGSPYNSGQSLRD